MTNFIIRTTRACLLYVRPYKGSWIIPKQTENKTMNRNKPHLHRQICKDVSLATFKVISTTNKYKQQSNNI